MTWKASYKQKHVNIWLRILKAIKLKIFLFCLISSNLQWEPGTKLFSMQQYCSNSAYGFGFLFLALCCLLSTCIYFQAFRYSNESSKIPVLHFTQTRALSSSSFRDSTLKKNIKRDKNHKRIRRTMNKVCCFLCGKSSDLDFFCKSSILSITNTYSWREFLRPELSEKHDCTFRCWVPL